MGAEPFAPETSALPGTESLSKARGAALALLSRRAYTRKGLAQKLREKGFPSEEISQVIKECLEKRYLDDYAYALRLAGDGLKRKGWGQRRAELELKTRGIGPGERQRALELIYQEVDEVTLAQQLAAKKLKRSSAKEPLKLKRQVAGYLSRRGFSAEVIGRVLRNLVSGEEEI